MTKNKNITRKKRKFFKKSIGAVLALTLISSCAGFNFNKDNIVYAKGTEVLLTEDSTNFLKTDSREIYYTLLQSDNGKVFYFLENVQADENGIKKGNLYIKEKGREKRQIAEDVNYFIISSDGKIAYFIKGVDSNLSGELYMCNNSYNTNKIADNVFPHIIMSPNGKTIAFIEKDNSHKSNIGKVYTAYNGYKRQKSICEGSVPIYISDFGKDIMYINMNESPDLYYKENGRSSEVLFKTDGRNLQWIISNKDEDKFLFKIDESLYYKERGKEKEKVCDNLQDIILNDYKNINNIFRLPILKTENRDFDYVYIEGENKESNIYHKKNSEKKEVIVENLNSKIELSNKKTKEEKKSDKVSIGLATDEGGINDGSFNQAANEGIQRAKKEFNLNYQVIEPMSREEFEDNIEALIEYGDDLVFGVGFQMADAIATSAEEYPDKNFVIIDSVVEGDNVESVTFKEHEGSFLMGVIAGEMTKTGKVGFIGGKDFPLINKFETGFAAGVKAVNPKAAEGLINRKTVKYADSFSDVNKGREIALSLYEDGCDIVYHAAGGVGIGLFQATKEQRESGKDVWSIGVDMDQAVTLPMYSKCILSSMVKKIDSATYKVTKDFIEGNFKGGQVREFGLAEDGVGISETTKNNVSKEVLDIVEKYKNAIIDGKIKVPSTLEELVEFQVPEI